MNHLLDNKTLQTTAKQRNIWVTIGVRVAAVLLVGFFSITGHLSAQNSYGTIVGKVTDKSEAVVPGASVKVMNTATGVVDAVFTTSVGDYTAINLVPGPYVVTVEMPGFQRTVTDTVNLTANQTLRADLTLQPGSVSQTVNVSAAGTLLDTDTAAVSAEISNTQVSDIPLASRNFLSLLALSPGTIMMPPQPPGVKTFISDASNTYTTPLAGGSAFIGGGQDQSNAYLLDGMDNNDYTYQNPAIPMPLDNIQDIRVMTKNYSAEYGGAADVVSVATKSGTNDFHGTAYDFIQNDALNANAYSFGAPAIKPVVRYNQFGESFGGPIWIPKIVDLRKKLFFFTAYEGLRYPTKTTGFGLFPTSDELKGNFSADAPIYEPGTTTQFPGNMIPSIDPVAAKVISAGLFATPNIPFVNGVNTQAVLSRPDNVDEWSIRGDYKITQNDSLFARYSQSEQTITTPQIRPLGAKSQIPTAKNVGIDYTHVFSASIVNDLRIGMNRPFDSGTGVYSSSSTGTDLAAKLFTGVATDPRFYGTPYFTFNQGYSALGTDPNTPYANDWTTYSLGDNVTFLKGAHTYEFGFRIKKTLYTPYSASSANGNITFNGQYTAGPLNTSGNPIADFLLGLSNTATVSGPAIPQIPFHGYDMFAQDSWKVNNRLTLNLGLRYEYTAPWTEEHNRMTELNPVLDTIMTPDPAIVAQVNSPLVTLDPSNKMWNANRLNLGPRVGFSYRPIEKTVVRAGYGVYFDTVELGEEIFDVENAPFTGSYGFAGTLAAPLSIDHLFPVSTSGALFPPVKGSSGLLTLDRNNFKTPYVEQWNLGIERELPRNSVVEVSYMGSSSTHLVERSWASQGVLSNPGPNAKVTFLYPNFGYIIEDSGSTSSNYNAGTVRFEKKFDSGYSLLAFYTWSHVLGVNSGINVTGFSGDYPQNAWDIRAGYGSLNYDVTNNFVLSGLWELPFGKGKALMNNLSYAANLLIGGWQFNGIWQAQGGFPYYIAAPHDNSGTAWDIEPRAQLTGQPLHVNNGLAFNPAAFAEPAPGTFGNESHAALRGLGIDNVDFSMFKNNYLSERVNFQLRVESFNVFNHRDTGFYPNTTLSSPAVGTYSTLDHAPRVLQVAGKIIF